MEKWVWMQLERWRGYRREKLAFLGRAFLRVHISATGMTALSLLLGLAAVYYLFSSHVLFFLFMVLHLLADALDGVIAAQENSSTGKYLDYGADQLVAMAALLKIGAYSGDYYTYLIMGLFAVAQLGFLASKMQAPILPVRTAAIVPLLLYPVVPTITVLSVAIAGVASLYSLARQLQWFMARIKA